MPNMKKLAWIKAQDKLPSLFVTVWGYLYEWGSYEVTIVHWDGANWITECDNSSIRNKVIMYWCPIRLPPTPNI